MKIWYWSYHDDNSGSGTVQVWGASEKEVRAKLRDAKESGVDNFHPYGEPVRLDIRPRKSAVIKFLTAYASVG